VNIVFLDESTLGENSNLDALKALGEYQGHAVTKPDEVLERSQNANVIITNKVKLDESILSQLPKLKLICEAATGLDNIDLEYSRRNGIAVKNVVGYSTDSVAQHTFSMLLYLINSMEYYNDYTSSGKWNKSPIFTHFNSFNEIKGKTYGIIGLGNIGKKVATIAEAFGAKIVYHSTSGRNLEGEYEHLSLDELLKSSDYISIHAPLNPQTKGLICLKELQLLKDNSILINVGRGGIISESCIAEFLSNKQGKVKIGLDVASSEPLSEECALNKVLGNPNLFITPHIAWASVEARDSLVKSIVHNIKEFQNAGT
jgi:glycerate dehydrogenase